jgi:hypothetical protein
METAIAAPEDTRHDVVMHKPHQKQSQGMGRREVQRRFPPGSWIVMSLFGQTPPMGMVLGWAQTPEETNPRTGALRRAKGWEALVLVGGNIKKVHWEDVRHMRQLVEAMDDE